MGIAATPDPLAGAVSVLGRPAFAPVVDELVRRFETGVVPVRLTLHHMPAATRAAVADLLGLDRLPGPAARLPVARLLGGLRLTGADQLRCAVEYLRGPLTDRSQERAAATSARESLWSWLTEAAAVVDLGTGRDRLAEWVIAQRAAGARGGAEAARARYVQVLDVLAALPAEDGISLAAFADDLLGDPHALDHGRSVAAAVLDAVAAALSLPRPDIAERARALWEAVGVVPDALSSTVLALGVPGGDGTPLAQWLERAREAVEPVVLTLATLRRWSVPPLGPGECCYVVENPSVVSAAAAAGWSGASILCSSGRPSVAVVTMIRQLTARGAPAHQHADFDAAGLSITAWLARHAGTSPWRMSADDYLAAQGRTAAFGDVWLPETPWDPALRVAMHRHGRPVYEEQLRAAMLDAMQGVDRCERADR